MVSSYFFLLVYYLITEKMIHKDRHVTFLLVLVYCVNVQYIKDSVRCCAVIEQVNYHIPFSFPAVQFNFQQFVLQTLS